MAGEQATQLSSNSIKAALDYRDYRSLRQAFKDNEIADIARIFAEIDISECIVLFRLVPRLRRAELFSYLPFERQEELLEELPDVIVASLLNEMEPDDRTRLLADLAAEIRNKILLKLDPEERQVAWKLLSYPEDSVGRLMTPDFLALNGRMKVSEALESIHWSTTLPVDFLNYLFVTGQDGELIGEVSLASLVVCDPPSRLISDLMRKSYVSLNPLQERGEAVEIFRHYDRQFIPVVDDSRHILGIVTADDVFDVAEEEATEDIHQFGGHGALEDSYFQTPMLTMLRKRSGWLVFLFVSGFITGEAIRAYEDTIAKWAFLMVFLPNIISSGGNSGTQSASLIIRGLAINELAPSDVWRVLRKELVVGSLLGVMLAGLGYLRAIVWGLGPQIGVIIMTSVAGVVVFGVIAGSMLPFLFNRLRIDPAVASSPFISTIVDVTGVLILINVTLFIMSTFG